MDVLTPRDHERRPDPLAGVPRSTGAGPTGRRPGRGGGGGERRRRWGWIVLAWPTLLAVVAVLALRRQGADRPLTVALVGFTPALAAPLVFTAVGAWRSNSPTLRASTALVGATFLFIMNPVSAVIGCGGDSTAGDITIYTANVLSGGGQAGPVADSILANGADVFALQEVSDDFLRELADNTELTEAYPHRSHAELWGHGGRIIWSRWPLTERTNEHFVVSRLVSATVDSPHGPFRLTNVHTQAPAGPAKVRPWQNQLGQLATLDTLAPGIMAGDFNATADHRPFRSLLGEGWTDVHEPKGCGFGATWPVDDRVPTPFYRLDHILVTDHFEVTEVRFGDPAGSDHRPVIAELRLGDHQLDSRAVDTTQP